MQKLLKTKANKASEASVQDYCALDVWEQLIDAFTSPNSKSSTENEKECENCRKILQCSSTCNHVTT